MQNIWYAPFQGRFILNIQNIRKSEKLQKSGLDNKRGKRKFTQNH